MATSEHLDEGQEIGGTAEKLDAASAKYFTLQVRSGDPIWWAYRAGDCVVGGQHAFILGAGLEREWEIRTDAIWVRSEGTSVIGWDAI